LVGANSLWPMATLEGMVCQLVGTVITYCNHWKLRLSFQVTYATPLSSTSWQSSTLESVVFFNFLFACVN
jgi:hypothetical protein